MRIQRIEGEGDDLGGASLLLHAGQLTDRDILEAFCAMGESQQRPVTSVDALNAIVARRILKLGIPSGGGVVLPTSSLVRRNMKDGCFGPEDEIDDGTLFALRRQLIDATDANDRMSVGVKLGDRAMHFAADIGGKHLKRRMKEDEARRYATRMGLGGYQTALSIANAKQTPSARRVMAAVPVLIDRFPDIVLILRELIREEIAGDLSKGLN